jgi:hypothetical protein
MYTGVFRMQLTTSLIQFDAPIPGYMYIECVGVSLYTEV